MATDTLTRIIKAMFLVLALGFLYVLFRSIGGPSSFTDPEKLFDDIVIGQTAARRMGSEKVWVTRLSSLHHTQANELNSHMVDANAGCALGGDLCVLEAATNRSGIDIVFTVEAPAKLPASLPWYGGFVDPTSGDVFDRLGRAYAFNSTGRVELTVLAID